MWLDIDNPGVKACTMYMHIYVIFVVLAMNAYTGTSNTIRTRTSSCPFFVASMSGVIKFSSSTSMSASLQGE